jgi:hypothetical protein
VTPADCLNSRAKWCIDNPATAASVARSIFSLRRNSTYSRTRRIAPADSPPCGCGAAGGSFSSVSIESKRGRVCRALFIGSLEELLVWSGGVTSAGRLSLLPTSSIRVKMSVRSLRRNGSTCRSKIVHKLIPARSPRSSSKKDLRATRFAPTMHWSASIASSTPGTPPSGGATAMIHSRRNCSRKNRSSMARADFVVRAPVSACARSESSGSIADTSKTALSLPSTPNTGAPEQLKFTCRDLKCWLLWTVTGRSSTMQVPIAFVPSISSDQRPPSQVPQYSKRLDCASSPRCSTAAPELSQNRTVYPASRTTLYK